MTVAAQPPVRIQVVLVALIGIGLADVGLLALDTGSVAMTAWWTTVGLSVGLLARLPTRWWPAVLAGLLLVTTAAYLVEGLPPRSIAVMGLSHVAQALVGALVVTRGGRGPARLADLTDLARLAVAAVAVGVVATAAETGLQRDAGNALLETAAIVFSSHAASTVVLAALALTLGRVGATPRWSPELLLQVSVTAAVTALVLIPDSPSPTTFVPIPFLVWGALRFEAGIVTAELAAFSFATTLMTALGRGPIGGSFGAGTDTDLVGAYTQGYVLAVAVITLPLVLAVDHRHRLLTRVSADEERFRLNFTASPLGMVFLHDRDGVLVIDDLNASACQVLAGDAETLVGRRLGEVVRILEPMGHVVDDLLRGHTRTWHGRAEATGRPGSRVEVALAALDRTGEGSTYSAQLLDVTQEHDARVRMEAAHKLTDATLDTTACVILVTDADGTVVRVNAATKEITGYAESELMGRPVWETDLAPLSRSEVAAMFVWPNRSGFAMVREQRSRNAAGGSLLMVWNNSVVNDQQGLPSYAVLTGVDVTAERSRAGLMTHLLQAAIGTALIGVDTVGRITVFNSGAQHMLGYSPEQVLGRPFVDLLDEQELLLRTGASDGDDAFARLVDLMRDAEETESQDWTWRTDLGAHRTVSMTMGITADDVVDSVGFLCVGRDVTAEREGQAALVAALDKERTAVERLQELDRAKDDFVSTVSHELRTPVTSIIGYTEMLRDGAVVAPYDEQLQMLDTIGRNGQRLVTICNDLLLLSGFEAGPTVAFTPVDLGESVAHTEESVRPLHRGRRLGVTFDRPAGPLVVSGVRSELDRVVVNLVSNAIKFTEDGGSVLVDLSRHDGWALLSVSDTGIGIPREDHDAIFDRFYRSEEARARAIPGTGLGLPIVASIVAAHGGRIEVESAPGTGTTFRVWLPLAP